MAVFSVTSAYSLGQWGDRATPRHEYMNKQAHVRKACVTVGPKLPAKFLLDLWENTERSGVCFIRWEMS